MIYTKEPWEIRKGSSLTFILAKDGNGHTVAIASVFPQGIAGSETEGNANLMKAAPKMREALKDLPDKKSILEEAAYTGGEFSKKWMNERGQYIAGYNQAIEDCEARFANALAEVEGKGE